MESEQAEQMAVGYETSKIPVLGIAALLASLFSVLLLVNTALNANIYAFQLITPYTGITTSIAFALSIISLFRVLFSRPVKWRSAEFVFSLIATILSTLALTPLLIEAIHVGYKYYIA